MAVEGFILDRRATQRSGDTIEWYEQKLGRLVKDLGDPAVGVITPRMLREWLVGLPVSAHTLHGYYRALRALFGWLEVEEDLPNPIKKVKAPKVPKQVKERLGAEDVRLLLNACKSLRDRALVILLYHTGIRAAEVRGLKVADLHLKEGYLVVLGKGNKQRQVPVSGQAASAIWKWLASSKRPESPWVFPTRAGTQMSYATLRDITRRLEERTGIHCNPHKFRRSFATQYAGEGNLFALQKIGGWESLEMVRHYANLNPEQVKKDYRRTMGE